jgi:hypothetical protein
VDYFADLELDRVAQRGLDRPHWAGCGKHLTFLAVTC